MQYDKEKLKDILGHVENIIKSIKNLVNCVGSEGSVILEKLEAVKAEIEDKISEEERTHGDMLEHKHDSYPHWHVAARIHKDE